VDVKKLGFENLIQPEKAGFKQPAIGNGPSFEDTLQNIQTEKLPAASKSLNPAGMDQMNPVKFSNHAVERMQTRGISFNKADMEKLNEAVSRAASKGSNNTLVLMNESALIVSVKNKTVVTVMDKTALKENVFTNIDSTIVM
jgi:flagellar operon protein